jgi:hypothetical protein
MRRIAIILPIMLALATLPVLGQGAKMSAVLDSDIASLKPGQFIWAPQLAPEGPMTVIVSLKDQRAYVYRNGIRIGASTISSGKPGHETPTGIFTILQKNAEHYSNKYNNAPMPYMQRLTWDGIALHAGKLPGYAASHGCVRLPLEFSKVLFGETSMGMTVVVANDRPTPQTIIDPGLASAPEAVGPDADMQKRLAPGEEYRWKPDLSPSGPVTVLVSYADQRVLVLRNGKMIGRARIGIPPEQFHGTEAMQMVGLNANGKPNWLYIAIPGDEADTGKPFDRSRIDKVRISPDFLAKVRGILTTGSTMVVSGDSFLSGHQGERATVLSS